VGVAGDKRVERPLDRIDAAAEGPGPLVLLERESDRAPGALRGDPGDVAVQRVALRIGMEGDRDPDEAVVGERATDVVARLAQRPHELGRHDGVLGRAPPDA